MKRLLIAALLAAGCATAPPSPPPHALPKREGHAVWIHAGSVVADADKKTPAQKEADVRAFVDQCARANIDVLVLLVKEGGPSLVWHSRAFPHWIGDGWKDFDLLESMTRNAHAKGLKVHAWVCDFYDSNEARIIEEHPEWLMRNGDGKDTTSEQLQGGRPYHMTWLCPSQRPGFVDQVMYPIFEELARDTKVDGIHHDYIRYPGDVAPDDYCFCDWCLEDMLRFYKFYYSSMPAAYHHAPEPNMPRREASWWLDNTIRPAAWATMSRREKADWFLGGKTMKDGRTDLNHFFYQYRCEVIARYKRESTARTRAIRPGIEWSAAVFKNPYLSGRNIAQRWTDWNDQVDILMPMNYRSHFPVDFDRFLLQLEETVRWQKQLCTGRCQLWAGIDVYYIFKEENEAKAASFPESKLIRTIEACRKGGADGIVIFAAGGVGDKKLWPALERTFRRN